MLACVDVDYREDEAVAACVLFAGWGDAEAGAELVERITPVEPYEPGQFYRRELPCLLHVLGKAPAPPDLVIVDGYVWLGEGDAPGLGAHLYEALGGRTPVVGVAKSGFVPALPRARAVRRGASQRPLYVTAAGLDPDAAADHVRGMHGPFRIPTLLKSVDQLCRGA